MFVIGIDPGLSRCGYGAVVRERGGLRAVAAGVITTPPTEELPARLAALAVELRDLLSEFRPDAVAVERVLFQTNARTAMGVGQASGLALAAAAESGASVVQYSPNEVKMAVVGYGSATKHQVQTMVQSMLGLPAPPYPLDAADALALAICHLGAAPLAARVAAALAGQAGPGAGGSRNAAVGQPEPATGGTLAAGAGGGPAGPWVGATARPGTSES